MLKTIRIKSIKKIGIRKACDLEVKRTHNFILGNGVLTHNTSQAQNSLRNLMETYSENCFFIFSCNDINKIIQPIRSRCQEVNFEHPNEEDIINRLEEIIQKENITVPSKYYSKELMNNYYPDIRSMVKTLQELKFTGNNSINFQEDFEMFLDAVEQNNLDYVIQAIYSNNFDIISWNRWYFRKIFDSAEEIGLEKCLSISTSIFCRN
jgi:DNA polymerase III delta prime subunit